MGSIGPWQVLLVLAVAVLLFGGRGRISSIMGDMAKGIRSFRTGLNEGEDQKSVSSDDDLVDVTPKKDEAKTS
ncbi:MAG: twin-arginine translocase TatA/TatE family subunit [Pseudomonadota bacterium]